MEEPIANIDYSCQADRSFEDHLTLEWQGNKIRLFECPGHSLGSICILVNNEILFSGDRLFRDYRQQQGYLEEVKRNGRKVIAASKIIAEDVFVIQDTLIGFYIKDYQLWEESKAIYAVNNISVVGMAVVVPENKLERDDFVKTIWRR